MATSTINTRIYVVSGKDGLLAERLVRTSHPARALEHVVASLCEVRVASQDDLERLLPLGVKVERPGEAPADSAPAPAPAPAAPAAPVLTDWERDKIAAIATASAEQLPPIVTKTVMVDGRAELYVADRNAPDGQRPLNAVERAILDRMAQLREQPSLI